MYMAAGDWKEMYKASLEGDLELVKFHLREGIDPNYQHPEILSLPLVAAIQAGHTEIVKALLEAGAKTRLISVFDNMTALQAAKQSDNSEIKELFKDDLAKEQPGFLQKIIQRIIR